MGTSSLFVMIDLPLPSIYMLPVVSIPSHPIQRAQAAPTLLVQTAVPRPNHDA